MHQRADDIGYEKKCEFLKTVKPMKFYYNRDF